MPLMPLLSSTSAPTPRLIELCESRLMAELLKLSPGAAAAEAPHLVSLADELGLVQLRRAAVAFIAQNYTQVQVGARQALSDVCGSGEQPAGAACLCVVCRCVDIKLTASTHLFFLLLLLLLQLPLCCRHRPCSPPLQKGDAWQSLDRSQVELVASQLSSELSRLKQLLVELEPPAGMGGPPKRRGWW